MTLFNNPTKLWDSDPGPGPLPPRWPSIEEINLNRQHYGLDPLPTSRVLTEVLRCQGFMACEGTPYLRVVEAVEATSEVEVMDEIDEVLVG